MNRFVSGTFHALKYVAYGLAALTIALICSWFLQPDEALLPEAQQLLTSKTTVPDAKNMYFALWGFDSAPEFDSHAVGMEIVAAHSKSTVAGEKYHLGEAFRPFDRKIRCDAKTPNCVVAFRKGAEQLNAEADALRPYMVRYRKLRTYPQFAETMPMTPTAPIPAWKYVLQISRLVDAKIAQDMADPKLRAAALEELAAEHVLWRRIAADADILITKMISVSALRQKIQLSAELLAMYPEIARQNRNLVASITTPLSPEVAGIAHVLDGEARYFDSLSGYLQTGLFSPATEPGKSDLVPRALFLVGAYKPNATMNTHFSNLREAGKFFSQSPRIVVEQESVHPSQGIEITRYAPATYFYNPVGKLITKIGFDSQFLRDYAYRMFDLVGYSRLLELQRQIIVTETRRKDIAQFLAAAGVALADPYTEKPMTWNAATGEISFMPRGSNFLRDFDGAVKIALGRE
jgi:hypothetical protein